MAAARPRTRLVGARSSGIFWLVLAVLGFHSFVAKPFYIPSESMLPGLQVGDQLVVDQISPMAGRSSRRPSPIRSRSAKASSCTQPQESWGVQLPFIQGRLFGRLPERGDVVIVTPPGRNTDYIKRVIGLPGDRSRCATASCYLNGVAGEARAAALHVDDPGRRQHHLRRATIPARA